MSEAARKAAENYITAINTKDIDLMLGTFAQDGELIHPFGNFKGQDALRGFYADLVFKADTILSKGLMAVEGNVAIVEVAGVSPQKPNEPQYACDVFNVNGEGRIETLAIYYRNMLS